MSGLKKVLTIVCCVLLLTVGWIAAVFSKSDSAKQKELIQEAQMYLEDEIYVKAVPLLEEAAGYSAKHSQTAEKLLKKSYQKLLKTSGYSRKYALLLEAEMSREETGPEVYLEAGKFYLGMHKNQKAFDALKRGIEKTGSEELETFYESKRYEYMARWDTYQDVTQFLNGMIQVQQDGYWGLANSQGELKLPCDYRFCSTYYNGEAIVRKGNVWQGVDLNGNRVALYKGDTVKEITNFNENRLGVHRADGWVLATGQLNTGSTVLEELRAYSDGGAAAKQNGKWGVVDHTGKEWLLEPAYDEIICDELGRCWTDGAVFVKQGEQVLLLVDGAQVGESYEDAQPFTNSWAAVKRDGKWGFIDREGTVQIDFQFENARSFTNHLAPVCVDDTWGYVSLKGDVVIDPIFLDAKQFSKGTAPVRTADGWKFISLLEYAD